MPDEFPYDVFLSHSVKDKAVVPTPSLSASNGERSRVRCRSSRLDERLQQDGLKVWFDEWALKPSVPLAHRMGEGSGETAVKIKAGLEHSRVLVLGMSANAFGSDWAQISSPAANSVRRRNAGPYGRSHMPFRDPPNQEHRFIPLRLDAAYSKYLPRKKNVTFAAMARN